jgi:integrase
MTLIHSLLRSVTPSIEAFENSRCYSYYAPFVKFLFLTGCRTGEAIGLKWKHISSDFKLIIFCESVSTQLKIRKAPKTHKARKFPCNAQLQALLHSIKPETIDPEALVFPAKRGGEINSCHFIQNAWKGGHRRQGQKTYDGIVTKLVKEGKVARYRTQYNTRHTFISMCLEASVSIKQIADWVGNSPETIMRHYAGTTVHAQVPEI